MKKRILIPALLGIPLYATTLSVNPSDDWRPAPDEMQRAIPHQKGHRVVDISFSQKHPGIMVLATESANEAPEGNIQAIKNSIYKGFQASVAQHGNVAGPVQDFTFGPLPGLYSVSTISTGKENYKILSTFGVATDHILSITLYAPADTSGLSPQLPAYQSYFSRISIQNVSVVKAKSTAYRLGEKFGQFICVGLMGLIAFKLVKKIHKALSPYAANSP